MNSGYPHIQYNHLIRIIIIVISILVARVDLSPRFVAQDAGKVSREGVSPVETRVLFVETGAVRNLKFHGYITMDILKFFIC